MCFSYVTEQNGWDIEYKTHVTNRVNYRTAHDLQLIVDGRPTGSTNDVEGTEVSDNYASIYRPLEVYVTNGPGNVEETLINYLTVYDHDYTHSLYLPVSAPNDPIYIY
jgi:hypothetical protein